MAVKLVVVLFVIFAGLAYVRTANWTSIPVAQRRFPQEKDVIPDAVQKYLAMQNDQSKQHAKELQKEVMAAYRIDRKKREVEEVEQAHGNVAKAKDELAILSAGVAAHLAQTDADKKAVEAILPMVRQDKKPRSSRGAFSARWV